jgi:hypothetical protein
MAQLTKPSTALLGPGALALRKDMTVVAQDTREPVHGGRAVRMIGLPESLESPESLVVLIGYMHGGESAPLDPASSERAGREPQSLSARVDGVLPTW